MQLSTAICSLCSIASGACNVVSLSTLSSWTEAICKTHWAALLIARGAVLAAPVPRLHVGCVGITSKIFRNLFPLGSLCCSCRKPPAMQQASLHNQSAFRQQGMGIHGNAAACGTSVLAYFQQVALSLRSCLHGSGRHGSFSLCDLTTNGSGPKPQGEGPFQLPAGVRQSGAAATS